MMGKDRVEKYLQGAIKRHCFGTSMRGTRAAMSAVAEES